MCPRHGLALHYRGNRTTTNQQTEQGQIMATYHYEVLRDGEILSIFDNYTEAMAHLHRIQPHSLSWAMEHEGYAITEQKAGN